MSLDRLVASVEESSSQALRKTGSIKGRYDTSLPLTLFLWLLTRKEKTI
jgi:hypothetical protein